VRAWQDTLVASEFVVGCPIATTALETAPHSTVLRAAAGGAYESWLHRLEEGLVSEGWPAERARAKALAVLSVVEGALLLSKTLHSTEPMEAALRALPELLSPAGAR
jgi:TetR/AcrR family transcriptional repressor of lmrAB and yxaGH operons